MGANNNPRKIKNGKLRCGSRFHIGNRQKPIKEFCKAKTPDGLSYSCKSCRAKENQLLCHDRYIKWKKRDPIKAMLVGVRGAARKRKLPFNLSKKDISIPSKCPVLGIPLFFSEKRTDNTPSIDRIDNKKGYISSNIVVCSWRANTLKKDASVNELILIANFYKKRKKYEQR